MKEEQVKELSEVQKAGKAKYKAVHKWIYKNYGKASKCESETCNKKFNKFHWVLKKGYSYEFNIGNFMQMCTSCHTKYDANIDAKRKRMSEVSKRYGNLHSMIKVIYYNGNCPIALFKSVKDASRGLGISDSCLSKALRGLQKYPKGIVFKRYESNPK